MAGEVEKRARLALDAIRNAFGTQAGEAGVDLFVEHHLAEIPESYWREHTGSVKPGPDAVLGLLVLESSWGEGDIENFDFSLPGDVTQYVVCVRFGDTGEIEEISMES
jgi:hypothetical protein